MVPIGKQQGQVNQKAWQGTQNSVESATVAARIKTWDQGCSRGRTPRALCMPPVATESGSDLPFPLLVSPLLSGSCQISL